MNTGTWCACCSEPVRDGKYRVAKAGGLPYCYACGDPNFYEYTITDKFSGLETSRQDSAQAFMLAIDRAISCGWPQQVDLVCGSRAAAHFCGELESYDEDPEASVTRRWVIRAEDQGRIA